MKNAKWIAVLFLVTAIWGSTFVMVKETLPVFGTFALLFLRFGLAAAALGAYCLATKRKISGEEMKAGLFLAVFLFVSYASQTIGLNYTSPTNSAFITGLFVILVPILSAIILRSAPEKRVWLAVALAMAGLYFLTGASAQFNPGDAITLFCALGYALHIVFAAKLVKKHDAINLTLVQLSAVAVFSAAVMLAIGETPAAYPAPALASVVFLGLFATLFAQWGQLAAQKHIEPSKIVLILILEPVFAALYSVAFFGEILSFASIFGATLILSGMLIAEFPFKASAKKK